MNTIVITIPEWFLIIMAVAYVISTILQIVNLVLMREQQRLDENLKRLRSRP